jgi:hypothetical protein
MIYEKIPFAGEIAVPENECERQFFETFPDVFDHDPLVLKIWTYAWIKSRLFTLKDMEQEFKKF